MEENSEEVADFEIDDVEDEEEVEVESLEQAAIKALSQGDGVKAARALESCCEILRTTDQDGRWPRGIRNLAVTVASEAISYSTHATVGLWAASCGVEMLRIFAPQSPFGAQECGRFFKMVAAQLRRLVPEQSTAEKIALQQARLIVDSLRGFQSVIALVEASVTCVEADEAVVQLVDACFGACRDDLGIGLPDACLDVACLLIAEASGRPDGTPPQLLDAVLATLLPTARAESPVAHEAARLAVLRLQDVLAKPISQFLQACFLLIQADANSSTCTTNKNINNDPPWFLARDQPVIAYALMYELHLISIDLVSPSLRHLGDLMTSEIEKCREAGATLFGRLCADKARHYARFEDIYDSWLRRFVDSSAQVRAHMVKVGLKVATTCGDQILAQQLRTKATERLDDPDHRVRRAAVHAVTDALHQDLTNDEMCMALGARIMDKKPEVRTDALTGLAAIFAKHHEEYALDWIPRLLLRSYSAQCNANTEVQERARLLLDRKVSSCLELAECLDAKADDYAPAFQGLELLLRTHATHQKQLNVYLDKREAIISRDKTKSSSTLFGKKRPSLSDDEDDDDYQELRAELDGAQAALALLVPGSKSGWTRSLTAVKDGKVFKALRIVADASASKTARLEAKTDAISRLSALDTEIGRRVESVADGALDLVVDAEDLRTAMTDKSADITASLVLAVAKQHPSLLVAVGARAIGAYAKTAASQRDETTFVKAAAMAVSALVKADPRSADKMRKSTGTAMINLALEDNDDPFIIESVKHAAEASLILGQEITSRAATFDFSYDTPGLVARLKTLGRIALHCGCDQISECLDEIHNNLIAHGPPVKNDKKKKRKGIASVFGTASQGQQFSTHFLALRAAIKVQSYAVLGDNDSVPQRWSRLACTLFDILENNGEPPSKAQCKPTERAELRRLAGSQALKLATHHAAFAQGTTPPRWRLLCSLIIDESAAVSTSFGGKLAKLIQSRSDESGIFAKWAPALCLLNSDDSTYLKGVRRSLLIGVRRARAEYARRLAGADNAQEDAIARDLLPEYALPYAIHLLARIYANTLTDPSNGATMAKPVARALTTLFDALTNGLDANAHNVAFLLRCCAEIVASSSSDNTNEHDTRLAAQAADLLKVKYVNTQAALTPFPGNIFLPSSLYPQVSSSSTTGQRLAQNAFTSYDDESSRRSSASIRGIHFGSRVTSASKKKKKRRISDHSFDSDDDFSTSRPLHDRDANSTSRHQSSRILSPISAS